MNDSYGLINMALDRRIKEANEGIEYEHNTSGIYPGPASNGDYGKIDLAHDIAKNAFIGACAYIFGDNNLQTGLIAAGALTAADAAFKILSVGEEIGSKLYSARVVFHTIKDLGIGALAYATAPHFYDKPILCNNPITVGICSGLLSLLSRVAAKNMDWKMGD